LLTEPRRGAGAPDAILPPVFLFSRAQARYRQGRFDDSIKLMTGEGSVMRPSPRLVLAMAQYQKGQKDQARKTLAAAVASPIERGEGHSQDAGSPRPPPRGQAYPPDSAAFQRGND
jgi:hypothetical protein